MCVRGVIVLVNGRRVVVCLVHLWARGGRKIYQTHQHYIADMWFDCRHIHGKKHQQLAYSAGWSHWESWLLLVGCVLILT